MLIIPLFLLNVLLNFVCLKTSYKWHNVYSSVTFFFRSTRYYFKIIFSPSPEDMFIDFRREEEGKRERERNIDQLPPVHTLTGDRTGNRGTCPDWEIAAATFWCPRWCSNQLSHLARAARDNFEICACECAAVGHWHCQRRSVPVHALAVDWHGAVLVWGAVLAILRCALCVHVQFIKGVCLEDQCRVHRSHGQLCKAVTQIHTPPVVTPASITLPPGCIFHRRNSPIWHGDRKKKVDLSGVMR